MTNCLLPKLVGTLTQTKPQAGKLFFSSENCKFYYFSCPPILSVIIIDFYVAKVKENLK
jgi:hypothetical protein